MTLGCVLLALACCSLSGGLHAAEAASNTASAAMSIRSDQLNDHIRLLADDTLEGREAGSRGGYAAGNYLVRYVQGVLKPGAGSEQYFQTFPPNYRNLLGILAGSDPKLRDGYILVGAHYDHVGYGNTDTSRGPIGRIHNGADDNASGAAALVEILQAFTEFNLQPRRSILFAWWDGEEKGMLGSQYFARNPSLPLKQIKLAINIDMIGRLRNQHVEIFGTRTMLGLRSLVAGANQQSGLQLSFPWTLEPNSDHHTFYSRQIPILMFHTGLHNEYHRPSDDVETLNVDGIATTARLIFQTVWQLANEDPLNDFRSISLQETEFAHRIFEQPGPATPPRLGIRWDPKFSGANQPMQVTWVVPGSDAQRAGVRVGDRVTHINGQPLQDPATLQQLAVVSNSLQLTVSRPDVVEPQDITVEFSTPPIRLGINWREDAADPSTATVVRVTPHSVAALAGLEPGDRIHQLDGKPFENGPQFQQLTRNIPLPASILIERQGQMMEKQLPAIEGIAPPATTQP